MKKYILCFTLFCAAFFLYAQETISGDDTAVSTEEAVLAVEDEVSTETVSAEEVSTEITAEDPARKPNKFVQFWYNFGKGAVKYLNNPEVVKNPNQRRRAFEVVLPDVRVGLANNMLNIKKDVFQENVVIDLDKYKDRIPKKGFIGINTAFDLSVLEFNYASKKGWGFGLTPAGLNGGIDLRLPRSFLALLADGNQGENANITDRFVLSGAVFYELGVNTHFEVPVAGKKLRVGFDPAYYVPLLYIPKSTIEYTLKTDTETLASIHGNFDVYTPVNTDSIDVGSIFSSGGVDFSISAEYPLFTRLDVGASISHIPLVPARLSQGMEGSISADSNGPFNIGDVLDNGSINIPDTGDIYKLGDFGPLSKIRIFRPVRFDFYTLYMPLKTDLLVIKPNIGWTLPTKATHAYFNGAAEVQVHLGKFIPGYLFNVYFHTGREEGFWRHRLGFHLNLRAFELDLGVGTKAQTYKMSYHLSGAEVMLGMKFGW